MKSATWLASISIVAQTLSAGCNSEGSFTTDSSLSRQDPYFRPPGRPPPAAPHQELSVDIDADPEALAEAIRVAHPAATEVTSDAETAFSFRVAPSFGGNCHVALDISVDIDFQASTNRILVSGYVLPSCVDPLTDWADVYFRILGDPGPSQTVTANASSSNLPSVDLIVLERFVQVIYSLESPGGNPYAPLPGTVAGDLDLGCPKKRYFIRITAAQQSATTFFMIYAGSLRIPTVSPNPLVPDRVRLCAPIYARQLRSKVAILRDIF